MLKKEDPNNELRVLSEIKISGAEEPADKNVTIKTSDLIQDPMPDQDQNRRDSKQP